MGKEFEDLSGKRFNKLLVIGRGEDYYDKRGQRTIRYNCQCDCGKKTLVRASALRTGATKSCGCTRRESNIDKNLKDLSGMKFGRWTVLYRAESNTKSRGSKWHCRCECGTERDISGHSLIQGYSKSCGCYKLQSLRKNHDDIIGQKFGRWLVLGHGEDYVAKNGRHYPRYLCVCECGNHGNITYRDLTKGLSVSCGCYRKEQFDKYIESTELFEDLSGNVFGEWTVLFRDKDRFYDGCGGRTMMYRCRCSCGTEKSISRNDLKSGISVSCGCKSATSMEQIVRDYLDERGIKYEAQKKFDNLLGVGGNNLSYDFAIYKNNQLIYLIECQGEQHYRPVGYFGGQKKFEIQQKHDALKKEYAKNNNMQLVEIKYSIPRPKIHIILDELFQDNI